MKNKNFYITRLDYYSGLGAYWVRLHRGINAYGQGIILVHKVFADSKYGGKRKALANAIKFRDAMCEKYNKFPGQTTLRGPQKHCRNSTGIVGVRYAEEWNVKKSGATYFYKKYQASWMEGPIGDRKAKTKSFYCHDGSFTNLTPDQAFAKAKAYRRKMIKLHNANT